MKRLIQLVLIFSIFLITKCTKECEECSYCIKYVNVTVLDYYSGLPIPNVNLEFHQGSGTESKYSDLGYKTDLNGKCTMSYADFAKQRYVSCKPGKYNYPSVLVSSCEKGNSSINYFSFTGNNNYSASMVQYRYPSQSIDLSLREQEVVLTLKPITRFTFKLEKISSNPLPDHLEITSKRLGRKISYYYDEETITYHLDPESDGEIFYMDSNYRMFYVYSGQNIDFDWKIKYNGANAVLNSTGSSYNVSMTHNNNPVITIQY